MEGLSHRSFLQPHIRDVIFLPTQHGLLPHHLDRFLEQAKARESFLQRSHGMLLERDAIMDARGLIYSWELPYPRLGLWEVRQSWAWDLVFVIDERFSAAPKTCG